ncbi:transposase family protein, partial [Streptomyces sp. NPDC020799]|uniref:transposase family protein n=1 Tax=Streptomyces sp. NPDC020799 TaxID=3365091 RepID=UPI0037A3C533
AGRLLWISPALPGRAHDLTAARTHRIIRICECQGIPLLADRACLGAGPWVTTPVRRPPGGDFSPAQRTVNRALSAARAPVERGVARLKSWRVFRKARCSPNRMPAIARAVLTLERQR